jgi:integrase
MTTRGQGRIFKRPGSQKFWVAFYLRGKQFRESTGTTDEKQALRFLKHRMREVGADQLGIKKFVTPTQQRVTVQQLLDALKVDFNLRGKDCTRLASNLKPIEERFGDYRATQLTSADIDKWVEDALLHGRRKTSSKPARPASINRSLQLLKQAYNLAVATEQLTSAPRIRHLSEVGNARQGFFSAMEFRSVLSNLPAYLRDFVSFAWLSAWRPKEIRSLTWLDVDGDVIRLRAENAKTRIARSVPLVGELAEVIARCRLQMSTKTTLVFHNNGAPIGDLRKAWRTACKLAGVPEKLFYDLRRSGVRDMIRSGVSQSVAMSISGHRTSSIFSRYNISSDQDQRKALLDRQDYSARQIASAQQLTTPTEPDAAENPATEKVTVQ